MKTRVTYVTDGADNMGRPSSRTKRTRPTREAGRPLHRQLHKNMVRVPGGTFLMGSNDFYPEERPVHRVAVDGFWMDEHPVTNAEFRRFVQDTGYVTVAERPLDPADYPEADPTPVSYTHLTLPTKRIV